MKASTRRKLGQIVQVRVYMLVIMSCLWLSLLGQVVDSSGGWISCPPQVVVVAEGRRQGKRRRGVRQDVRKDKAQDCVEGYGVYSFRDTITDIKYDEKGREIDRFTFASAWNRGCLHQEIFDGFNEPEDIRACSFIRQICYAVMFG